VRGYKAYDATDVREFVASEGYTAHIKANLRRAGRPNDEDVHENEGAPEKTHPARRWVVERTISWLIKRRGLRTRWSKKSENWLALVRFACAHVLLNLAVFG
jgi:putative transposase